MSLRDRLLALLRAPDFSPANEFELARRLALKKKERSNLAHEIRLLLKSGEFSRGGNGRLAPRGAGPAKARRADERPIFIPRSKAAREGSPKLESPALFAPTAVPPAHPIGHLSSMRVPTKACLRSRRTSPLPFVLDHTN